MWIFVGLGSGLGLVLSVVLLFGVPSVWLLVFWWLTEPIASSIVFLPDLFCSEHSWLVSARTLSLASSELTI